MDRRQIVEQGKDAKRRTLQFKDLEELLRIAKELEVPPLPNRKLFSEREYKQGLIEQIVHRTYRNI
jgi:hypothetical protein